MNLVLRGAVGASEHCDELRDHVDVLIGRQLDVLDLAVERLEHDPRVAPLVILGDLLAVVPLDGQGAAALGIRRLMKLREHDLPFARAGERRTSWVATEHGQGAIGDRRLHRAPRDANREHAVTQSAGHLDPALLLSLGVLQEPASGGADRVERNVAHIGLGVGRRRGQRPHRRHSRMARR